MDPVTSAKTTVTIFRCSVARAGPVKDAPHALQNLAPAGFSWPQLRQTGTSKRLERDDGDDNGKAASHRRLGALPRASLPAELVEFLKEPHAAVIATVRSDGAPYSAATWYDWEDGRVLVNMDFERLRLEHMRRNPRVAITVLDLANWYRAVTVLDVKVAVTAASLLPSAVEVLGPRSADPHLLGYPARVSRASSDPDDGRSNALG